MAAGNRQAKGDRRKKKKSETDTPTHWNLDQQTHSNLPVQPEPKLNGLVPHNR
jgi:hypothetical protein